MKRYALVTGASRGIGRAVATHLSRREYSVILSGREKSTLDNTLSELAGNGHVVVTGDLGTELGLGDVARAVSQSVGDSGLHALVHCAAESPDPEVEMSLSETTKATIDSHITATAASGPLLLKALKADLAKPDRSHAILMSSDWVIEGIAGPPIFSAAKSFATTVWRQARVEYLRSGIVLSSLIAGNIATYDEDWEEPKWSLDDDVEDVKAELGNTRVALRDVVGAIDYILNASLAAVTEINLIPLDPDYVP